MTSVPASSVPPFVAKLAPHAWWILLLAALAALWLATERRIDRVEAVTNLQTWSASAPERDASSPTGFEKGQRRLIAPGHHSPSYWWIMEAQQAAAEGSLRLRHIDYDAAPEGRELRRTSLYRWWLIAVGWARGALEGEPVGYAIERGALVADPVILGLMLALGATFAARRIGSFAAIGFVVGGISLFPLASNFQPGAPDPRSLAWALALGSLLPLLASKRKSEGFAIAGFLGGLGLWNDAPSQAPALLAVFLGGLCYELARGGGDAKEERAPSHWRAWGLAGALTTLAASVFEFAPSHFSWSLDSVSPVHAAIWWGMAEILRAVDRWFRVGREGFGRGAWAFLAGGALAVALWPTVGMLSDSGALLGADFQARQLANHPSAGSAANLGVWLKGPADAAAKWATLLPVGLLLVLLVRGFLGKLGAEDRGRLALVFGAAAVAFVLAWFQLRWWNLFDAFALVALAALFAAAEKGGAPARVRALGALLLVLPGLFVGFPRAFDAKAGPELSPLEVQAVVERDFSYWLAKRGGDEPITLFSTPIFSGGAAYYGGFDVIASSDDGNEAGFATAARLMSASNEIEISILLNSRGVTHIALPLWDPMLEQLARIGLGLPAGQPLPDRSFSVSLRRWIVPSTLRPMSYLIPKEQSFEGYDLTAFAVQAEQARDLHLSRQADLFVERGQLADARRVRDSLEEYPRSVYALGAIANVSFAARERDRFEKALETLIPYLSRRSARDLPADRRISLATLFVQTQHADLARDQLVACLETLDAAGLRDLSQTSVVRLLALSRTLKVPIPSEELRSVAMELIPPTVKARFAE